MVGAKNIEGLAGPVETTAFVPNGEGDLISADLPSGSDKAQANTSTGQ